MKFPIPFSLVRWLARRYSWLANGPVKPLRQLAWVDLLILDDWGVWSLSVMVQNWL